MTHTLEIVVDNLNIQALISLDGGNAPMITTNEKPTDMLVKDWNRIGSIINRYAEICKDCGEIHKIEVKRIGYVEPII